MAPFLCHECGLVFPEELEDLSCPRCGAARGMIEDLDDGDVDEAGV
jgi:Zn finger protein HypA/HybF involved in hydrogenase expression